MATLSLFADRSQLAAIREFVEDVGRKLGLSDQAIYDVRLAVDEACSNVVGHAYGGQGGPIEVTLKPVEDGVQVLIHDWGQAFDPAAVPVPDVKAPLEQRPLGGLGLFLMRQMMDDIEFTFDEKNGNTLKMVKSLRGRGA
jgi:serine/threonine-protein kinase RsbW